MMSTKWFKGFMALAVAVGGIGLGGAGLFATDPAFAAYDASKLTVSGDIRVRPEFRRGATFGFSEANNQFVQQRIRLGFNYDVSPDVGFFLQFQDSRNWGTNEVDSSGTVGSANSQNNPTGTIGIRQGYVLIKNAGVEKLSLKVGRQVIILGDHRLIGSFDWNNNGWSFDGVRADYATAMADHMLSWLRIVETDCADINSNACTANPGGGADASADADLIIFYNTFKMVPGMTIEPYWMYLFDNRTLGAVAVTGGGTRAARTQADQKRHFLGLRVNGKAVNNMLDYTGEVVWQTGNQDDGTGTGNDSRINAWAAAVKAGVTLKDMMWSPRLGFEVDYASGSASAAQDRTGRHTFEGLFPTNHLHYGFMDNMAWKNMVDYNPQIQLSPTKASKLDIRLHILRLASSKDNWYGAAQTPIATTRAGNQAASLGKELDIIYTHNFKDGKVGVQIGYGHFFPGEYHARSVDTTTQGGTGIGNTSQDWGYAQVTTKF